MKTIKFYIIAFISILSSSAFSQNDDYMNKGQLETENLLIAAKGETLIGHNSKAIEILKKLLLKDNTNALAHYELARIYVQEKQSADALKHAILSTQYDDHNKWYLLQLSDLYKKDKNYTKNIETIQKLQLVDGIKKHYTLKVCNSWIKLSKPKKALKSLQKYTDKTKSFDAQIVRKRMSIYRMMKQSKKEHKVIQDAITQEPTNIDWQLELAKFHQRQGNNQKSQTIYAQILNQHPKNIQAAYEIAKNPMNANDINSLNSIISNVAYDVRRKIKLLFPHLQRLLDNPEDNDLSKKLIGYGKKLTELHKDNSISWAFLADVQQQTNLISSALDNYKMALKLNKSIYTVWEQALHLMVETHHYHDLQTYSESAMEYYPNKPYIFFTNGLANMHFGQLKKAERMTKESLLMSGRNKVQKANSYNLLSLIYFKQSYNLVTYPTIKDKDLYLKSLTHINKAIQLNRAPKFLDDLAFIIAHKPNDLPNAKLSIEGMDIQNINPEYILTKLQSLNTISPKLNYTNGIIAYRNSEYAKATDLVEKDLNSNNEFYIERISLLLKLAEYLNDQIKISYYTKKLHNP